MLAAATIVLVGSLTWIAWSQLRDDPDQAAPPSRSTRDFVVDWRCLNCRHQFRDHAGSGPRICPRCQKNECYVSLTWACSTHGTCLVAFQYDDHGQPTEARLPGSAWQPALNEYGGWNIKCPRCNGPMTPIK